jgi:sec-independent protein translocase protein TatA
MPNIGPLELAIVFVIVLLIFGPKRLPGLGRQLGTGMREFKESITGRSGRDDDDDDHRGERSTSGPRASTRRASGGVSPLHRWRARCVLSRTTIA